MAPHLVRWDREYREKGLVVLDIDNGAIDEREKAEAHVKETRAAHPVAWDEEGKTCEAYGIRAYPTAYLIGKDGKVVWEGHPLPSDPLERRIRRALGL